MKLADITTEDITTLVGLLTELQKDELIGKQYTDDSFYNPIQDANDNWIISTEEMIYTTNPDTLWVKELELIVYEPKQTEYEPNAEN
jgi:hypothetical protein